MKTNEIKSDYYQLFSSERGKLVLEHLKNITGLEKTIANPLHNGTYDIHQMLLNEGARKMMIFILKTIEEGKPKTSEEEEIVNKTN